MEKTHQMRCVMRDGFCLLMFILIVLKSFSSFLTHKWLMVFFSTHIANVIICGQFKDGLL